jgi:natural resistance-associated macrophage protein
MCCTACREQFSPLLRYGLWIMAEIAIIGSDIQEVIGSAIALLLLSRGAIPLWGGVLLSVALSFTMLLVERCGIRKLEGLFGVLISIMVGSFAVSETHAAGDTADAHRGLRALSARPWLGSRAAFSVKCPAAVLSGANFAAAEESTRVCQMAAPGLQ